MKEKEIAFIERITAGVTHEVNNVLASIREISGLLADILSMTSEESFPRKEKFETSIHKIQNQEKRGVKLINQLNKFAHLPDVSSTEVDLNELIDHLIFLTERFGRIKNIELHTQPSGQSVKVITNPFYLQMALFNCVEYFLKNLEAGGKVLINPDINKSEIYINILAEGDFINISQLFDDSISEELIALSEISKNLSVVTEYDNTKPGIKLKLPINN
jgi:two-component system NtrC family sensor kinase